MALVLPDWALPLAALCTAFLLVYGLYQLLAPQPTVRGRLAAYSGGQAATAAAATRAGLPMRDRALSDIAALDRALRGRGYAQRLELDLARAALPMRVGEYLLLRWLVGVAAFLAVYLVGVFWGVGLVLGALGFYAPRLYLSRREGQRIRALEDQLVDALTMMANSLKGGASFLQAMEMVAGELPDPVAAELAQVVAEIGVGAPLEQALTELTQRVRSYDLYLVVTAMIVQRRVGGNLAEVLNSIAHTIRERQQMLRQARVETSEMRLSAYVLIALPVVMFFYLLITNPKYVDPLLTQPTGRLLLVAAVIMQMIGFYIMSRIADVKV